MSDISQAMSDIDQEQAARKRAFARWALVLVAAMVVGAGLNMLALQYRWGSAARVFIAVLVCVGVVSAGWQIAALLRGDGHDEDAGV